MELIALEMLKQCVFGFLFYNFVMKLCKERRNNKRIDLLIFVFICVFVNVSFRKFIMEPFSAMLTIFLASLYIKKSLNIQYLLSTVLCIISYFITLFINLTGASVDYCIEYAIWRNYQDIRTRILIILFSLAIGIALLKLFPSRSITETNLAQYSICILLGIGAIILVSRGLYIFLYYSGSEEYLFKSYIFWIIITACIVLLLWIINEKEKNIKIHNLHKERHREKEVSGMFQSIMLKAATGRISKEEGEEILRVLKEQYHQDVKNHMETKQFQPTGLVLLDEQIKVMWREATEKNINIDIIVMSPAKELIVQGTINELKFIKMVAGLIRNAIRAVERQNAEVYRQIQIWFGSNQDNCYEVDIYDSGEPFQPQILANLGQIGVTTGGTGYGFPELFEMLEQCNGSMVIEEWELRPMHDTKSISIIFDGLNQKILRTYRRDEFVKYSKNMVWTVEEGQAQEELELSSI